ncbi:SRPBCC domain-containing protein [Nocardia carnea]|uniref:SRPBCC domain-containing protein n=1 Tax=Nocardia carnea TaxID=37328 RepID=UPI0024569326|nr:SRPBCC domain-containing protein [Nocardia carnea]
MEFGKLEREIRIDAAPEIVFEVVSRPEHMKLWWPDDATFDAVPGSVGTLVFDEHGGAETIKVVEVEPPRRFVFRWIAPDGELPEAGNSLLVTFELEPADGGTILHLTESGWREKGWEAAMLEQAFHDHEHGWDLYLPKLRDYAPSVVLR